jgi:hypothetical protein
MTPSAPNLASVNSPPITSPRPPTAPAAGQPTPHRRWSVAELIARATARRATTA